MKIVSVDITSFGKLKKLHFSLDAGVNVLQQNNGYGKTTLANFIRAMLYGLDYKRPKRGEEHVTAAWWATWNSTEKIGGSMVIEHNGATYRVERYFGLTAKSETLSVVNVATGKSVDIANVGEYFLGLTAESYDRSAYFPQEAVEISSNENFDSRLAGLVQNDVNYDAAQGMLRKYRKELQYERGDGGLIYTLENNKLQLQRQLAQCQWAEQREKEIDARRKAIAAERERCKAKTSELNNKIDLLQTELAQKQLVDAPTKLKLDDLKNRIARNADLESDKLACDALAEKIEQTPQEVATKRRPINLVLVIVALVLLAAGIGMCFWLLPVGIGVAALGAAVFALAFFLKKPQPATPAGENNYLKEYYNIASKYFYSKDMSFAEMHKAMWQTYNDYTADKREYEMLLESTRKTEAQPSGQEELQQLREELQAIQSLQENLSREEGSIAAERKTLVTDTTSVIEQIADVEQKLREAKHNYQIAGRVADLLRAAKENLSVMYLPQLCDRCKTLLNQITAGNYRLVIDRTFSIQLHAEGGTKPLDNFSRGIREITLLCFRIALSELLFGGNIPFLIIDDAFVNFDEENFLRATQLLQKLSQNTQILYFTCLERLGKLQ